MISQRWNDYVNVVRGGSKNSAYIAKIEAQNKLTQFHKIRHPSQYLINKYGNKELIQEPVKQFEEPAKQSKESERHPINHTSNNIEDEYDFGYDDYQVPEYSDYVKENKKKNKPLSKLEKEREQKEIERENKEREEQIKLRQLEEIKIKKLKLFDKLKKDVVTMKDEMGRLHTAYIKEMDKLKSLKGIRKIQKDEMIEKMIVDHKKNEKNIQQKFTDLFQYIKDNKITDINKVHKHLNDNIKKVSAGCLWNRSNRAVVPDAVVPDVETCHMHPNPVASRPLTEQERITQHILATCPDNFEQQRVLMKTRKKPTKK